MARGALIGGTLLGCIELVSYFMSRSVPGDPTLYLSEADQLKMMKEQEEMMKKKQQMQASAQPQSQYLEAVNAN